MSLISAIRTFIVSYTELDDDAPVWVDYLGALPVQYAIVPLPGTRTLVTYLDNSKQCSKPFAFKMTGSTADDAQRLVNEEFAEEFAEWLDEQTINDVLPTLDSGKTPERIEATSWGFIEEQGKSETAVYLITCQLIYEQVAP
jgi:hypothetical protein